MVAVLVCTVVVQHFIRFGSVVVGVAVVVVVVNVVVKSPNMTNKYIVA